MQNIAMLFQATTTVIDIFTRIVNTYRAHKRSKKVEVALTVVEVADTIVNKGLPLLEKIVLFVIRVVARVTAYVNEMRENSNLLTAEE